MDYDYDTDTYRGCNYCKSDVAIKGGDHCPRCDARMLTMAEVNRLGEDS